MNHQEYCNKIKQERRYRDQQRYTRIVNEQINLTQQLQRQQQQQATSLQEIQKSRRYHSEHKILEISNQQKSRNEMLRKQNKRVIQLLRQFREEQQTTDKQIRQHMVDVQEQRNQILQQRKQQFILLSNKQLKEHQQQIARILQEKSIYGGMQMQARHAREVEYNNFIIPKLRSKTYDNTIIYEKEKQQERIAKQEQAAKLLHQSKLYSRYVNEQFLPIVPIKSVQTTVETPITVPLSKQKRLQLVSGASSNDALILKSEKNSTELGNLYLKNLRQMKKKQPVEQVIQQTPPKRIDYLKELKSRVRSGSKCEDLYSKARRLELNGINSMGRDGGKYLIDAIKTKLMILNL